MNTTTFKINNALWYAIDLPKPGQQKLTTVSLFMPAIQGAFRLIRETTQRTSIFERPNEIIPSRPRGGTNRNSTDTNSVRLDSTQNL